MKFLNVISRILGILAVVLLIVSVVVCFWVQGSEDTMQSVPRQAASRSEQFMEALARGDLESVEGMLYGESAIGTAAPEGDGLEKLVWDAYCSSFSYEWKSTCYPVGESVCQNVSITGLDIPLTMTAISLRTQELMALSEQTEEDTSEPEEDTEGTINRVLLQAAREILTQEPALRTSIVTLTFVQSDGVWLAVPDVAVRNAIAGGLGG